MQDQDKAHKLFQKEIKLRLLLLEINVYCVLSYSVSNRDQTFLGSSCSVFN